MPFGTPIDTAEGPMKFRGRTGRKQIPSLLENLATNGHHLGAGLALAVNHFGGAAADGSVVIDLGEIEISKGKRPKLAQQAIF